MNQGRRLNLFNRLFLAIIEAITNRREIGNKIAVYLAEYKIKRDAHRDLELRY